MPHPLTDANSPPWGAFRPSRAGALCLGMIRQRTVRGVLRKPLVRLLARLGPICDVEVRGLRLRCRIGDNVAERRILFGAQGLIRDVARITRDLAPGGTFVDVGANAGMFAVHAAKAVGPQGCVLAVEPSPEMVERLRFNVNANGFKNVRIAAVAVGDRRGQASFHTVVRQHGKSSLHEMPEGGLQMTVPVEPLLSLVSGHGLEKIDAMKIDIEGYEDRALMPFFADAPSGLWPRRILIETLDRGRRWRQDCLAHLLGIGYSIEWQSKKDALLSWHSG
jgi:FkbM family methyltransferase